MIRYAVFDDIPAISALMASKVPHFRNKDICFSINSYEQKLEAAIAHGGNECACFVADVDGTVAAAILCYIILHPTIGERVGMEATWVADPRFPGRGAAILKTAAGWFRERGVRRFFVACNDDRTARLLELLGLSETERIFEKVL